MTGDGRLVKGGGPTVKNVTGYDLPRLFVGSFGTLGVLAQVTLRCRPRPAHARWFRDRRRRADRLPRPRRCCGTVSTTCVLLEGARDRRRRAGGRARSRATAPALPDRRAPGPHLGRRRARCARSARALDAVPGARWCAELGVGTVHVAGDDAAGARAARARSRTRTAAGCCAKRAAPTSTASARALPNAALMRRIKDAFDPDRQARTRAGSRYDRRRRGPARTSTTTSSSRASRAGCACRTARRTASPGSRSRRRAAASRRCASSSSTARRSTTRSTPR